MDDKDIETKEERRKEIEGYFKFWGGLILVTLIYIWLANNVPFFTAGTAVVRPGFLTAAKKAH